MASIGIETGSQAPARQLTLAEEFRERGIPVLPTERVLLHKRSVASQRRPTWLHDLAFGASVLFRWMLWIASFRFVPICVERGSGRFSTSAARSWNAWFAFIVWLAGIGVLLGSDGYGRWWFAGVIPFVCGIVAFSYQELRKQPELQRFAEITGYWVSERLPQNEILCGGRSVLRERLGRARQVPGASIYQEVLDDDPFLYAKRGFGPFAERVYFGAYATKNRELDMF